MIIRLIWKISGIDRCGLVARAAPGILAFLLLDVAAQAQTPASPPPNEQVEWYTYGVDHGVDHRCPNIQTRGTHRDPPEHEAEYTLCPDKNGESCWFEAVGNTEPDFDVYCKGWTDPNGQAYPIGHVSGRPIAPRLQAGGGATPPLDLQSAADGGDWADKMKNKFACAAPEETSILGKPARQLTCTHWESGWRYLAFVVDLEETGMRWFLDGEATVLPDLEELLAIETHSPFTRSAHPHDDCYFPGADIKKDEDALRKGAAANDIGDYSAAERYYQEAATRELYITCSDNYKTAEANIEIALQKSNHTKSDHITERHRTENYNDVDKIFDDMRVYLSRSDIKQKRDTNLLLANLYLARAQHDWNRNDPQKNDTQKADEYLRTSLDQYTALLDQGLLEEATAGKPLSVAAATLSPVAKRAIAGMEVGYLLKAQMLAKRGKADEVRGVWKTIFKLIHTTGVDPHGIAPRADRLMAVASFAASDVDGAIETMTTAAATFQDEIETKKSGRNPGNGPKNGRISDCDDGHQQVAITHMMMGDFAYQAGRYPEAKDHYEKGVECAKAGSFSLPEPRVIQYLKFLDGSDSETLYPNREYRAKAAFEAEQLVRGTSSTRVMQSGLSLLDETNPEEATLERQISAWENERNTLTNDLRALDNTAQSATRETQRQTIKQQLDDVGFKLGRRAEPGHQKYLKARREIGAISADNVQKAIGKNDRVAALSFFVKPTRVSATLITRHNVIQYYIGDGTQYSRIHDKVKQLREYIEVARKSDKQIRRTGSGRGNSAEFDKQSASELYCLLFKNGDIKNALSGIDRIAIVTSGPIQTIPLEMLVVPATCPQPDARAVEKSGNQGHYLIEDYAISYMTLSPHIFANAGKDSNIPNVNRYAYLEGPIVAGEEAGERTDSAVRTLESRIGAQIDKVVPKAEIGRWLKNQETFAEYGTIILLTHGYLAASNDENDEPRILIEVSPDGKPNSEGLSTTPCFKPCPTGDGAQCDGGEQCLKASQVQKLRFNRARLFLLACDSASTGGRDADEDSFFELAAAFIYAGTRELVVAHWEISDVQSLETVARALGANRTGILDFARALQEAKRRMIHGSTDPSNPNNNVALEEQPYYWAPLVMISERGTLGSEQ